MNNKEILELAIKKAVRNDNNFMPEMIGDWTYQDAIYQIFKHDFAKAFWGYGENTAKMACSCPTCSLNLETWQYHLQQLVIKENPVQYLKQFLK